MRNFRLVLFSEKEMQDLIKGCQYLDIDQVECQIDYCQDICENDLALEGDCTLIDACGSDLEGDCSWDVCSSDTEEVQGCYDTCVQDN